MAIEIKDGILKIGGREVFLFGGEVQYFRIRPKNSDPARTYNHWEKTLDLMVKGRMNLVTTYVPWDYHENSRDAFDFSGAKDLDRFLGMCHDRGLFVQVKPGPYITAEWPLGPRTFGAVPMWIKNEHPETLVITSEGKPLTFDVLGSKWGRQCTFLHPFFLERVRKWYEAVFPVFIRYIKEKPCIWSLQIDNETNLYWNDRHVVDYSPTAIAHYREFLKKRYTDIGALNGCYGSRYRSFEEVEPPHKPPRYGFGSSANDNPPHIDWYEAGWAYVEEYLLTLRKMVEETGIREPDVLFTTNDTPALTPRLGRNILFWRGSLKNRVGLCTLDSYPRSDPLSRQLDDICYQTDYAARLMDFYGDKYPLKHGEWVMGAEMQGGMFGLPIIKIRVRPEATARQVTRALGSGVKAYAVFVLRQGYNLNNSLYRFQAAIDEKGRTNERFDVLAAASGSVTGEIGPLLNRAKPVEAPVAVLTNRDYQVPLAGARIASNDLWHTSYGGAYGWLKRSGFPAQVVDIKDLEAEDLARWKALLYVCPGLIGAREAAMLLDYMQKGGMLILMGWPGEADLDGKSGEIHRQWGDVTPSRFILEYKRGTRLAFFIDKKIYHFRSWKVPVWEVPGKNWEIFLKIPSGGWVGGRNKVGKGNIVFISSDISRVFNTSELYKIKDDQLEALRALMGMIMGWAGIERVLDWSPARAEVWARKAPDGKIFLFCLNDGSEVDVVVRPALSGALGIDPAVTYSFFRVFRNKRLPKVPGRTITNQGIKLSMGKWESEIVLMEPGS